MKITLDSRIEDAVGGRTAAPLEKSLGLQTVGELLRHYPRRLAERGELTNLDELRVDDEVTVLATVKKAALVGKPPGQRAVVTVSDGRGELDLVFFGGKRVKWRVDAAVAGTVGLFSGKVGVFNRRRQLVHPEWQLLQDDSLAEHEADAYSRALIPVYPATKEVRSWTIANSIAHILDLLDPIPDPVPPEIRARHNLLSLDAALRQVHRPDDRSQWWHAKQRLKWDEAFAVQLVLAQRRRAASLNPARARPAVAGGLLDAFDAQLPFELTAGQREVGATIAAELAAEHPMQRLLQGEVGSGKTVVALRAMLQAVDAGGQAALLAPT